MAILIPGVEHALFSHMHAKRIHVFNSSSPTIVTVPKYMRNNTKFQILLVQMKIFTEVEPRGISASFKPISILHFKNKPLKKRILHFELNHNSRTIHIIYSTHNMCMQSVWDKSVGLLHYSWALLFLSFLEVSFSLFCSPFCISFLLSPLFRYFCDFDLLSQIT